MIQIGIDARRGTKETPFTISTQFWQNQEAQKSKVSKPRVYESEICAEGYLMPFSWFQLKM